jgi:hypothetical protein
MKAPGDDEIEDTNKNETFMCIQHIFDACMPQVIFSMPPKSAESEHFANQAKTHHYLKIIVQSGSYKHCR